MDTEQILLLTKFNNGLVKTGRIEENLVLKDNMGLTPEFALCNIDRGARTHWDMGTCQNHNLGQSLNSWSLTATTFLDRSNFEPP